MKPENESVRSHAFLADMYRDSYFPKDQVDRVKGILLDLCGRIEQEKPGNVEDFLRLTHEATERINGLAEDFERHHSELETVARETMAGDFAFIAEAYGFGEVDREEIIAPRDW